MPRRAFVPIGLANLLIASVGLIAVASHGDSRYPKQWDKRVQPLISFVEHERGLTFKHPVYVDFMTDAKFRAEVVTPDSEISPAERIQIQNEAAMLRAFGLLAPNVDLLDAFNDAAGGGVVGLYDNKIKRVRVRGNTLTPEVKVTLAHELTHVLQDQYWGLDLADDLATEGESTAFRAIAEGDADHVEHAYEETLTDEEQKQADEANTADPDFLTRIPQIVIAIFAEPYVLGDAFIEYADSSGGTKAINKVFDDRPTTEEQLMDPTRYYAKDAPKDVDRVELTSDETSVRGLSGDLGAVTWYLILAQRIDPRLALRAADGWGGDDFRGFTNTDGTICVRAAFTGDTEKDAVEMNNALLEWQRAGAESGSTVVRSGDSVTLQTCDTKTTTAPPRYKAADLLGLLATRTYLDIGFARTLDSSDEARCVAGKVVDSASVQQLLDVGRGTKSVTVLRPIVDAAKRSCGG